LKVLFNLGPFPGGGDCLVIETEHGIQCTNSNDVIAELEIYDIFKE
jgi:hypothetical protein